MKLQTKEELLKKLEGFDVKAYAKSRNFVDGSVSKLSPYITHGIITPKQCIEIIVKNNEIKESEKFLMELVWKEFFLQVQKTFGNGYLDTPIWEEKTSIPKKSLLPSSVSAGTTGVGRIDTISHELKHAGWLHNHKRMRLASRCCHWAKLDWKKCADRTYYHFIDGELSANHLSRQWVNSTFSNKAYFMNEENLDKYRPGTTDENLHGSYEHVAGNIFDAERVSSYWDEQDMTENLKTPSSLTIQRETSLYTGSDTVRILSPWKLDETLLSDEIPTMIFLDADFTIRHPRSDNRLKFIKQYTDTYDVPFVTGSYNHAIDAYLDADTNVILDERRDPVYREVQQSFTTNASVDILPYDRVKTTHESEPIMKFFKYRNKTLPFIKKLKK